MKVAVAYTSEPEESARVADESVEPPVAVITPFTKLYVGYLKVTEVTEVAAFAVTFTAILSTVNAEACGEVNLNEPTFTKLAPAMTFALSGETPTAVVRLAVPSVIVWSVAVEADELPKVTDEPVVAPVPEPSRDLPRR